MKNLSKKLSPYFNNERIFRRVGIFVENKRLLVIIISLVLIAPAIVGATQMEMATGYETFISEDSQIYQDYEKFTDYFSDNVLVVLITGNDLIELLWPDNVDAMATIETEMSQGQHVLSVVGPVFFMKQIHFQQTFSTDLPRDSSLLMGMIIDPETGDIRPEFKSVFPDKNHALIAITLEGGLTSEEEEEVVKTAGNLVASTNFIDVTPTVTGTPTVWGEVVKLMNDSMRNMLILSIFLMLLILIFIFSVRGFFAWRWLPLGVVFISLTYTFGVMGVLSIPITMATMAVFPIVIGLGVDYAIQFHNRYDEEARRGETAADAIIDSITHIGPAIGIAIVTACLGFAALFFSPVPMVRSFGYMLIIGVVLCYFLAISFLLAILYTHDRRAKPTVAEREKKVRGTKNTLRVIFSLIAGSCGFVGSLFLGYPPLSDSLGILITIVVFSYLLAAYLSIPLLLRRRRRSRSRRSTEEVKTERTGAAEKILKRMAPFVIRKPAIIIPIAVVLTIAGLVADPRIETETDEMKFISQDIQVIQDIKALDDVAGSFVSANLLVEANDIADPSLLDWMLQLQERIATEQPDMVSGTESIASVIVQISSSLGIDMPQTSDDVKDLIDLVPSAFKINLVNDDCTAANIIISIKEAGVMGQESKDLTDILKDYIADPPAGVAITVTGMPIIGNAMFDALTGGRMEMTLIGIALVFAGLLLMFKFNLLRASQAILPIVLIIGWSSGIMYLLGIKYTPLTATMSALIIGIGVEFTILLMMRYQEERRKGESPVEAMITAMTKIGRAIVASGLTVIGGFGALLIARDFIIVSDFGVVTMINVAFALCSTLIVLPPLIVWIDSWRERRRIRRTVY